MLHQLWFLILIIALITLILLGIFTLLAKQDTRITGFKLSRKLTIGIVIGGILASGVAVTLNKFDPVISDADPKITKQYRAQNSTEAVAAAASSLKTAAASNSYILEPNPIDKKTKILNSTATKIFANTHTKKYLLPGSKVLRLNKNHQWVVFTSEAAALAAGYTAE